MHCLLLQGASYYGGEMLEAEPQPVLGVFTAAGMDVQVLSWEEPWLQLHPITFQGFLGTQVL